MSRFCSAARSVSYKTIKRMTGFLWFFLLVDAIYALRLFISAVKIRNHIGYFINLVSSGDGDVLPSLQAVPVLLFLLLNCGMAVLLYLSLEADEKPGVNTIMFSFVIIDLVLIVGVYCVIFGIIGHSYAEHESLHNGILDAMTKYSSSLRVKRELDEMQIEFQCCGSKKYEEWYNITWYDAALNDGTLKESEGHTPFSCCSVTSLFPCVHHNIENTGKNYLYTPEFNLSISTNGCYHALREKKQSVGWSINLNLFLFSILQGVTLILFRFIQTAHSEKKRFMGRLMNYKIWLCGCRRTKGTEETETDDSTSPSKSPRKWCKKTKKNKK